MIRFPWLCAACLLLITVTACNDSGFTGAEKQAKPHPAVENPVQDSNIGPNTLPTPSTNNTSPQIIQPPPGCTDNGITQVELLTPSIDLASSNRYVEYRISRTDCQGQAKPFAADKILFDLDTYGISSDLQYSVIDNGVAQAPRRLALINGSDLFGHTSAEWAHWETDEAFATQSNQSSIQLRVFLGTDALQPRAAPPNVSYNDSIATPSYLRFGNALPATQNVMVTHIQPIGDIGGGSFSPLF